MLKKITTFSAIAALGGLTAVGAHAVTDGEADGDDHPHVALMVALDADGNPMWRCSGTFLSPTVYLTAGHCTFGATTAEIWLDGDVESNIPANGYIHVVNIRNSCRDYIYCEVGTNLDPDAFVPARIRPNTEGAVRIRTNAKKTVSRAAGFCEIDAPE